MSQGRRLFVVDPSLKDVRGHHFTLAKSVTESAILKAMEVTWLGSRDASEELFAESRLDGTFGLSMYSAYQQPNRGIMATLSASAATLMNRIFVKSPRSQSISPDNNPSTGLAVEIRKDLERAIKKFSIGPADRLLFHTADGATYTALAELVAEREAINLPLFHVSTPYDPIGVMPNRQGPESVHEAINRVRDAHLLDRRVFLHAENPFLADHLSELWKCNVRSLDLPVRPVTEDMKFQARLFRRDNINVDETQFVVASLGAARMEKGFHLIPDIVRRTFELAGSAEFSDVPTSKIKFVLHASAQIIGRHQVIAEAIKKLQRFPAHQVQLLMDPLTDVNYQNLTLAADAVLMPYDPRAYKVRGSGVVTEAIVARKFIIAKSGSYPAEMALWQGGAVGDSPMQMARGLLTLIKQRWQRFPKVKQASIDYVDENSTGRYVQKLFFAERDRSKSTNIDAC